MTDTIKLFEQTQLAEASYAFLQDSINNQQELKNALIALDGDDYDFSPIQATEFVTHWRVVSHIPDTTNGFSATLFESLDNPEGEKGTDLF